MVTDAPHSGSSPSRASSVQNLHYGPGRVPVPVRDGDFRSGRRPGRRRADAPAEQPTAREREILELRAAGLRLAEIGRRFGLSRQRVAQIVDRAGRVEAEDVREARRDLQLDRALRRSDEILDLWRRGKMPLEIARETGIPIRTVRAALKQRASDADREARANALARLARPAAPRFSDRELLDGLRRVALRLGHVPSGNEYARLAGQLSLATTVTVCQRFGSWGKALAAAGLEPAHTRRVQASRWHIAACWNAVKSVADQLGNPPRYRRYVELYAERDDLPSPATLRVRLGLWSEIAAALAIYADADRASEREARAA